MYNIKEMQIVQRNKMKISLEKRANSSGALHKIVSMGI